MDSATHLNIIDTLTSPPPSPTHSQSPMTDNVRTGVYSSLVSPPSCGHTVIHWEEPGQHCVQYRILHPVILRSAPLNAHKDKKIGHFLEIFLIIIRRAADVTAKPEMWVRLDCVIQLQSDTPGPPAPDLDTWVTWPANYHLIFLPSFPNTTNI